MRVEDVMTAQVHTIDQNRTLLAAKELMEWAKVRHLPVLNEEGGVVGMISQRDILKASISVQTAGHPMSKFGHSQQERCLSELAISEFMQPEVQVTSPRTRVQRAARLMREEGVGSLLVVGKGKLAGILSAVDLLEIVEKITDAALEGPAVSS